MFSILEKLFGEINLMKGNDITFVKNVNIGLGSSDKNNNFSNYSFLSKNENDFKAKTLSVEGCIDHIANDILTINKTVLASYNELMKLLKDQSVSSRKKKKKSKEFAQLMKNAQSAKLPLLQIHSQYVRTLTSSNKEIYKDERPVIDVDIQLLITP